MNTLLRFLEKYQFLLIFLVLEGFSIGLLVNNNFYQKASFGKYSQIISRFFEERISIAGQYLRLRQTNSRLFLENVSLRNELAKYQHGQNTQFKPIADTSRQIRFSYIPARIINNSVNKQHNYITLNVGANDGIQKEMGVISGDGVIGVVAAVSNNFSIVISMLNTDLKVSAKHKPSNTFGSIHWDGLNYREILLTEIPQHVNLTQGDTIVTSGFSSMFPPGIPIGTISIFSLKGGSFYETKVRLIADFKRIEHVYVVKSHNTEEWKKIQNLVNE